MKAVKYLAMVIVGIALIGLSGCQKETSALWKKGGEWNLISMHRLSLDSEGETINEKTFEDAGTYIFKKDGSFTANISTLGGSKTRTGTYVYENDMLTLTSDGDDGSKEITVFSATREGNSMTLVSEQTEEDGSKVIITQVLERK